MLNHVPSCSAQPTKLKSILPKHFLLFARMVQDNDKSYYVSYFDILKRKFISK